MDRPHWGAFGKKMDNNIIITIQQLLIGRNPDFDNAQRVKLVRHKDNRPVNERKILGEPYEGSLYNLYRTELKKFLDYQSEQRISKFGDVEYIVSFIGEEGTESRFIVTFNKKDFLEAESLGLKIQTPKEFLEEMEV